jgi:hypothetical protein
MIVCCRLEEQMGSDLKIEFIGKLHSEIANGNSMQCCLVVAEAR